MISNKTSNDLTDTDAFQTRDPSTILLSMPGRQTSSTIRGEIEAEGGER